jgi:hypothetical protein
VGDRLGRAATSTCALGAFLSPFLIRFHQVSLADAGKVVMFVYGFRASSAHRRQHGRRRDGRRRVDGRLLVGTASIVIPRPLMYLALTRPAGDVLMFSL